MAEPLLKRTLSRLRGKDRSRRKTDPKLSDVPVKSNTVLQTSSSPSSPSMMTSRALTSADLEAPSPPRNHITVAKKQQWARQGSVALPPSLVSNPIPQASDWEKPSRISQDAFGQAWSQKLAQDKTEQCGDRRCVSLAWDTTSTPCVSVSSTTVQQEALQPAEGSTDAPASSVNTKLSGQRAYLQSLDRSSRAWVLSSGKSQASDGPSDSQEDSGSNIWYNPIPEEEDSGGPCQEEEIWRRRDEREEGGVSKMAEPGDVRKELEGVWVGSAEDCSSDCPLEGHNPSVSHHVDDITAENTDSHLADSIPPSQKKGGVAGSVMDRLRSPGTVRRLSLKMKKLPELRRKLSLRSSSRSHRHGHDSRGFGDESTSKNAASLSASNQNVISRYHLDSSAPPARPLRRSFKGCSTNKGGYLSDGDSPELPRQQGPQLATSQEAPCDNSSFQLYLGSDPPRCNQRVTGLLTVHLLGLEEMKSSRFDGCKEVFLGIQIDGVTRARTALLTLRGSALSLNHTFHLELERARQLRVVVLTPAGLQSVGGSRPVMDPGQTSSGQTRNRVCCLGGISIPPLFKASRSQQLRVKLEPRGLLYVKLSLQEKWDAQPSSDTSAPANVFGVELHHLVEKEGSAVPVPLLIQKTVAEIERRGLKVVGLYRLCGSAAVKKELRDWFERNSSAVCLSEDLYPDINVITGILKDYLRELPSPLITRTLYNVVREAMALRPPPALYVTPDPQLAQSTVELLACLPPPEKATLSILLDHLSLVASLSSSNRMTHQNLAVCFGPVLLTPTQEAWRGGGVGRGGRGGGKCSGHIEEITSAVDFKRHIEALHYLLQLWPVPAHRDPLDDHIDMSSPPSLSLAYNPLGLQQHWHPGLRLALTPSPEEEEVVVSRRGRSSLTRLESPPPVNRYAGDWSICGRDLLSRQEADYDEVAESESDGGSGNEEEEDKKKVWSSGAGGGGLYMDDFIDVDAPFNCRLSLKDFDTLIHDLDRELAKQINICL